MASDDLCPVCDLEDCEHSSEERLEAVQRKRAGQPPLVLAGDDGQIIERKRSKQTAAAKAVDDLRWLMRQPSGRRFMWALLKNCHMYGSSYALARGEHAAMAFAEGERNIGLQYLNDLLKHCADSYALMVKENEGT